MKKILFLMMLSLSVTGMKANEAKMSSDSLYKQVPVGNAGLSMPLRPTYLDNVSRSVGWGSNWFIEAKGVLPHSLVRRSVVVMSLTVPCQYCRLVLANGLPLPSVDV